LLLCKSNTVFEFNFTVIIYNPWKNTMIFRIHLWGFHMEQYILYVCNYNYKNNNLL
jgi:hypothetical protein